MSAPLRPIPGPEGWGVIPSGQRKAHYYVAGTALCRGRGWYFGPLEPDTAPSRDDCATCRRQLTRRQAAARKESAREP